MVGESAALRDLLEQVELVAPTGATVLIRGETGTGKELVARAIHNKSDRRNRAFVTMNCSAFPSGLLENELFGHEAGAFTGASGAKIGRFDAARGGTLFLDEVGDIALELQAKFLRVLEEGEFERVGSATTRRADVRIISATNRNLAAMLEEKQFRRDLYYRLNVFPIVVPPLRERRDDIGPLVRHFTEKFSARMRKRIETIPPDAIATMARYHWPGNIRELQHIVERAVLLSNGPVLQVPLGELANG